MSEPDRSGLTGRLRAFPAEQEEKDSVWQGRSLSRRHGPVPFRSNDIGHKVLGTLVTSPTRSGVQHPPGTPPSQSQQSLHPEEMQESTANQPSGEAVYRLPSRGCRGGGSHWVTQRCPHQPCRDGGPDSQTLHTAPESPSHIVPLGGQGQLACMGFLASI